MAALREGEILDGKYRILRVLGKGGMGTVYVAENVRVKRQIAIKVLSRGAVEGSGDAVMRFEREAQAAGQIGSDHIVEVLDLGVTDDGDRFMVMELLEGETLKDRTKKGRIPAEKLVDVFLQLLDGLEAAHAAGIVHRDLKPDNVFLQKAKAGRTDWVKILDFGISKFSSLGGEAAQNTRTGVVMGTPYYMSPEQARSASSVDARSDLYTVGVMLYEMLVGQVPFPGTTFAELMFKIVFEPQPHPRSVNPTIDDELAGIVVKAMSRDVSMRFQTAAELRAALAAWAEKRAAGLLPPPSPFVTTGLPLPPHAPGAEAPAPLPSMPPPMGTTAPPTSSPMGTTAPPISAMQRSWNQTGAAPMPAPSNGKGAFVAAGLAVLLVGSVAAFFTLRGGREATPPAALATPAPKPETPPPAPPPTASETPVATATPQPTQETPTTPASAAAPTASALVGKTPAFTGKAGTFPTNTGTPASTGTTTKKVVVDYGY